MRTLLALCALAGCAFAQFPPNKSPAQPRYQANFSSVLSTAVSAVTVQATATSGHVSFENAVLYCSVACTYTLSINGTAATTTPLTVTGPLSQTAALPPNAFSASNAGSGTALQTWYLAAAQQLLVDLTPYELPGNGGTKANLTITSSSISGTASIQIQWVNQ